MVYNYDYVYGYNYNYVYNVNKKLLFISFILIVIFMVVEVIGGIMINSLVLFFDVGYMFFDVVVLGLSLVVFKFGEKVVSFDKIYGYKRFEILVVFFNGLMFVGIFVFIFYEVIGCFFDLL